jgi:tetratricopeptide (TPR) repeat protein
MNKKLKYRALGLVKIAIFIFAFNNYSFAQDFKINDKKPIPIPTGTQPEKPVKVNTEANFVDGMKYFLMEEYPKALDIFEKTLKDEPDNAGLHFQISVTYQKLNKINKAIEYAQKAYDLNNKNKEYAQMLAALYAKNDQFDKASTLYKVLFEQYPNDSEIGLDLAASYYSLSKYDEVLKIYQRIENNLGPSREITNQKQRIFLRQNKLKNAIEEGEKLINSDPQEIESYIDLAELLIRNEKEDAAQMYIDKALKISPNSGQLHILMADIARRKKDLTKMFNELNIACDDKNLESAPLAKILYNFLEYLPENTDPAQKQKLINKIIEIHPTEPRGYLMMGDMLFLNKNKKEANQNYLKAIALEKNSSQIWMKILSIDHELGAFNEALAHSEEAIELYPNQAIFWYYNGSANFMLKQFDKANEALEESKRLAGDEKELVLVLNSLLGESYNRLKLHTRSDEAYELVLKADPTNDAVANNYSYFLALRNERLPYALELASKLIERNPTNSTFLDTYGWILYMTKDYEKSKIYLEKAYQSNASKSPTITEHYGDVLYKLGEKEKAIEIWKLAATKDSKNKNLEQKISTGKIIE